MWLRVAAGVVYVPDARQSGEKQATEAVWAEGSTNCRDGENLNDDNCNML
jgi:hypothetical protein